MVKQTFGGTNIKQIRTSGFRKRSQTKSGRKILKSRRKKGRKHLSISSK